ncbi:MAG: NADH:ubiquinone reductase (Na(+)-transporting) subunit B [Gammaproteobacteria bacterium]|nr:NADH:ubiquinone reductase (Na(+)-transporting) subunit B [Gammaproteobacteria bacterium]NNF49880.1 NADH:ubiquinone reductase (Na(+)-transporting) subunit B [Woeseiaceae bacterium]MBT8094263.1 NADH:ubiquinone reductase (Na(+)-transporting) subunit B [Gammaproteobacteria bacterium]MBT8104496.1 NADH:ubiquinone reductase (Na(+)-transporting) subunit B [Gammaproteobacteria bacterium]NNK24510.1 NADH:ubiquinone reductase (Na(+)-transporting) subunit B [Woeseiaceae bacterium]
MKPLRSFLDRLEPLFTKGGRFEQMHALFEAVDTFLYSPADLARGSPHLRDAIDLKRVMILVVFASVPAAVVGMWNTGFQANMAMQGLGLAGIEGWRGMLLALLGAGYDPNSLYDCVLQGALYFLPIYIVTMAVGLTWEVLFAAVRNHEVNEGFFVTGWLYALILPATIPLWQVAVGITFAVIIGKEVFGGTGKNFLNIALLGRAFLYFAYPAQISGDAVWTAADGFTGATVLGIGALEGMQGIAATGITWTQAFIGQMQGSIGETSALACLIGGAFLIFARIASWRIIVAVFLGLIIPTLIFGNPESSNPMMTMPWYWHIVVGGFAFGAVFMATDPVSAAQTDAGKWVFGLLIGFMTWLIRVVNPAFPEGIMLAILFANVFAPVIDYFVVRVNVKRRLKRNV